LELPVPVLPVPVLPVPVLPVPVPVPVLPVLLEPGEPDPVELESGAMPVPMVLPSVLPVVVFEGSASFALLASFAGRSWLHAARAKPKAETNTATCSRTIVYPFMIAI
jgi:signal-induced proliferation-associated 1 like protein 3